MSKIIFIVAFVTLVFVIKFLNYDLREQDISILGNKCRRYSVFSFEQCIENQDKSLIKEKKWLKQKNKGKDPQKYKKKITYEEHINCECLVSRKGL